jgi:hypothetical protein
MYRWSLCLLVLLGACAAAEREVVIDVGLRMGEVSLSGQEVVVTAMTLNLAAMRVTPCEDTARTRRGVPTPLPFTRGVSEDIYPRQLSSTFEDAAYAGALSVPFARWCGLDLIMRDTFDVQGVVPELGTVFELTLALPDLHFDVSSGFGAAQMLDDGTVLGRGFIVELGDGAWLTPLGAALAETEQGVTLVVDDTMPVHAQLIDTMLFGTDGVGGGGLYVASDPDGELSEMERDVGRLAAPETW